MLNSPLISQAQLTALHQHGTDTYKIRFVFPRQQSRAPLKVYGHAYNYEARYDSVSGRHICEIPNTAYMARSTAVTVAFAETDSIAEDIAKGQASRNQKLLVQTWPWVDA